MNLHHKPPRKKTTDKRNGPENSEGKRPGERDKPAAAERTDDEPVSEKDETPARSEPAQRQAQPVTNQDEQDKITNAPPNDIPLAE